MAGENKALARSFFEQADRGRTPVELCAADFTAQFPGLPPMDLEGFDQFEAMFRSAFSSIEHALEELVEEGDDVAVRLRSRGSTWATSWVCPPVTRSSLSRARRSCA